MSSVDIKSVRLGLFSKLDDILDFAHKKILAERQPESSKLKWSRVLIAGIIAYGNLLENCELELIEERLKRVELSHGK